MPPARLISRLRPLAVLLLLGAVAAPLSAATPRDELLRYVPDDVGFVLLLSDLRGHSAALADSPFAEQFRASPAGQALEKAPELKALTAVDKELEKQLGVGWSGLREDILGDAFIFAFRPGPPGKQEMEQELVLIRARDEKKLADLVNRINESQKRLRRRWRCV
jgi:hypothetical protein